MGDRGNILMEPLGIYFYTHWGRHRMHKVVQTTLRARENLWHDDSSLAAAILIELYSDQCGDAGIDREQPGDVYTVVEVNTDTQQVTIRDDYRRLAKAWTFSEFIDIAYLEDEIDDMLPPEEDD